MRTDTVRAFALGIITGSFLTAGVVMLTAPAKADPQITDELLSYAVDEEPFVCRSLAHTPTVGQLMDVLVTVSERDSLSAADTGTVVTLAVADGCPQYMPVLKRFVAIYAPNGATA